MALPDGVHDSTHDVVFFTLPPDVHCVSCFRQTQADEARTHSADTGIGYEPGVAARGSVQKSVVLLCRRPLFGVLADRLVPAVRAYFEQGDFARTDVLASLYHSLNISLCRPSLQDAPTLFHGLDLRFILRKLGPQTLAVLKLILLERRVVVYSQPVQHASNAVAALASIFAGALDSIAPSMQPLDFGPETEELGLPLRLFSQSDRIVLQPYAPLPLVSELIPNHSPKACLIGTSHNVGLLLSSTAAAAAKKAAAAARSEPPLVQSTRLLVQQSPQKPTRPRTAQEDRLQNTGNSQTARNDGDKVKKRLPNSAGKPKGKGGVPIVDALVNLSNGKVSVSGILEPLCRITRAERRFMRDLIISASNTTASVSSSGAYVGSDDYVRRRLREYVSGFLRSVASVDGVLGGPVGWETWSSEMIDDFDFGGFDTYNEKFVRAWMQTRNSAHWARKCRLKGASFQAPPKPELDESLLEEPIIQVDRVAAGLSGIRQNVAEFGRLSSYFSSKAVEGFSSFFKRVEQEVAKIDTAVSNNSGPSNERRSTGAISSANRRGTERFENEESGG